MAAKRSKRERERNELKMFPWASTVRMPRETLARIAREQRKDGVTIRFRVLPTPPSSSFNEDDEEKNLRREKMMVVSVVKVTTKKKEEGEGDEEEEEEEEEIARFESRENELVPGDLCEVEERMTGGVDASASVVAKLARKFHPTRDETAKNQAGTKCKTCLLYTSPSPRDQRGSRMPSSA